MVRFRYFAAALFASAVLSADAWAQSSSNGAPLGSKNNPIPVKAVGTPLPQITPGAKGKRGSKTNPITGQTHPRSVTVH